MGIAMAMVCGIVCIAIGILTLTKWFSFFLILLKGSVPLLLILIGLLSLFAAIGEFKESSAGKDKEETPR